jgi:hypothetical protein
MVRYGTVHRSDPFEPVLYPTVLHNALLIYRGYSNQVDLLWIIFAFSVLNIPIVSKAMLNWIGT